MNILIILNFVNLLDLLWILQYSVRIHELLTHTKLVNSIEIIKSCNSSDQKCIVKVFTN